MEKKLKQKQKKQDIAILRSASPWRLSRLKTSVVQLYRRRGSFKNRKLFFWGFINNGQRRWASSTLSRAGHSIASSSSYGQEGGSVSMNAAAFFFFLCVFAQGRGGRAPENTLQGLIPNLNFGVAFEPCTQKEIKRSWSDSGLVLLLFSCHVSRFDPKVLKWAVPKIFIFFPKWPCQNPSYCSLASPDVTTFTFIRNCVFLFFFRRTKTGGNWVRRRRRPNYLVASAAKKKHQIDAN